MNKLQRTLATVGIAGASLGLLGGCDFEERKLAAEKELAESDAHMIVTVLDDEYEEKLAPVRAYDGLVSYSNETVKLESEYTLIVEDAQGDTLAVSVVDVRDKKGSALRTLIKTGSIISFPRGNLVKNSSSEVSNSYFSNETYFTPETQFGSKRADRITIIRDNNSNE